MRLDQRLVLQNLAVSRAEAARLIAEGAVRVDGQPARKASQTVGDGARLDVERTGPGWVGRGALKLLHALDQFRLVPSGTALDLGASTGGFTEVLLARGAEKVIALDVGHGQLHPRLAADPRVTVIEGVNARSIPDGLLPRIDWITADLSFISLRKALTPALAAARPGARLVVLVKPQFELGPEVVGKGGIVRDPAAHAAACRAVADWLGASGWTITGESESPVTGGDGNREFMLSATGPAVTAPGAL
ncbi:MAG: TlyA family RNA methyltransferase [Pseudomonadota bacterium]